MSGSSQSKPVVSFPWLSSSPGSGKVPTGSGQSTQKASGSTQSKPAVSYPWLSSSPGSGKVPVGTGKNNNATPSTGGGTTRNYTVNSYRKEVNSLLSGSQSIYDGMKVSNARKTYTDYLTKYRELKTAEKAISKYIKDNEQGLLEELGPQQYEDLKREIEDGREAMAHNMKLFQEYKDYLGQWDSDEAYEHDMIREGWRQKYDEMDAGTVYDTLQGMEDSEEKQWLQENAGYLTGFSSSLERNTKDAQSAYQDYLNSPEYAEAQGKRNVNLQAMAMGVAGLDFDPRKLNQVQETAAGIKAKADFLQEHLENGKMAALMENIEAEAAKAEQEYQEYIHSQEYAAWELARNEAIRERDRILQMSGIPLGIDRQYVMNENEKALRDKAEYYRSLANSKQDSALMEKDLEEIRTWTEPERVMLATFILERDREALRMDQDRFGFQMAEQNAAPLMEKYGRQKVLQMAESVTRYQNQENSRQLREAASKYAGKDWKTGLISSVASVAANVAGGITSPLGIAKELGQRTGRYTTLDPNNVGSLPNLYAGAVRQEVGGRIEASPFGKGGKVIYDAAMGAMDNIARIAVTGGYLPGSTGAGSLVLAATGSFGQAVSEYSSQGASPVEAVMMGIVSGGLEVITEKISVDNLLEELGKTIQNPKGFMEIVKAALQAGGVEVTEEEASFWAGLLAEAVILRGKSGYNQQVQELMVYGMPEDQAREQAGIGVLKESWETAVQSFLSGTLMSGATNTLGNIQNAVYEKAVERAERANQKKAQIQGIPAEQIAGEAGQTQTADLRSQVQEIMESIAPPGKQVDMDDLIQLEQDAHRGYTFHQMQPEEFEMVKEYVRQQRQDQEDPTPMAEITDEELEAMAPPEEVHKKNRQTLEEELGALQSRLTELSQAGDFGKEFSELSSRWSEVKSQIETMNVEQGGINNDTETGAPVSDRGQAYANVSTQEHAGGNAQGRTDPKAERRERSREILAAKNLAKALCDEGIVQRVSADDLGFENGSEKKELVELPRDRWTEKQRSNAEKIEYETGNTVHYIVGRITVTGVDGTQKPIRGMQRGNDIFIRADHAEYNEEQIGRHEKYHAIRRTDAGMDQRVVNRILETFDEQELLEILGVYKNKYKGLYSTRSEEEVDQIILEELLANAYAEIGDLDPRVVQYKTAVTTEVERTLYPQGRRSQENGTRETRGPDAGRFSIDDTVVGENGEYENVVVLDTNLFNGVKPRNWSRVLRDYVYKNMAGSQVVMYDEAGNAETVHFAKTNDRVTKEGAKNSHKVIDELARHKGGNVKSLAIVHLPEALTVSKHENTTDENKHQWLDANGWIHRTVFLQDKQGRIYSAMLNIADGRGRKILYDINNIRQIDRKRVADGAVPSTQKGRGSHIDSNSIEASQVPDDNAPGGDVRNELASTPVSNIDDTDADVNAQEKIFGPVTNALIKQWSGEDSGRYAVDDAYADEIDEWNRSGRPEGARFILGATGDVLQGLGAIESDIYINGDKINTILEDHPEMSLAEIKRIPEVLEDPVLILKSRNTRGTRSDDRLVIFSTIKARDGRPIMCVMDMRPVENGFAVVNMQKVSSAYTKDNKPEFFIRNSDVLFADKKRTPALLRTVGFQVPTELQRSGYIGSINYEKQDVKIQGVPFKNIIKTDNQSGTRGRFSVDDGVGDTEKPDYGVVTNALIKQWSGEDSGQNSSYQGKSLTEDPSVYSYSFLTSQEDMDVIPLGSVDNIRRNGRVDQRTVIQYGMENARSVGTERAGKVYVRNAYTGRELRVDVNSIRHGLNGDMSRLLTNARLGSVIGDVVQNAIPINALHNKAPGIAGTYAMAGYAADESGREFVTIVTVEQRTGDVAGVDVYDVTHAVSGRQKRRSDQAAHVSEPQGVYPSMVASSNGSKQAAHVSEPQGVYPSMVASKISIANLIDVVNETYQSILSEDVLKHLGQSRNVAGYYYDKAKFSIEESQAPEINVAEIDREMAKNRRMWDEAYLKEQLGEEGYAEYRRRKRAQEEADRKAKAAQAKAKAQEKQVQQQERTARKTEQAKAREEKQQRNGTAPVKAKWHCREQLLNLFSVSAGMKREAGRIIDRYLDRIIDNGRITDADYKALFDHLYAAGVVVVPADEYYAMGRSAVAGGRIYINDSLRADLGDDFQQIRRRAWNNGIYLTNNRMDPGVDVWNDDLASILPGLFDSEETDMRSALERILEIAEEGKDEHISLADYTARLAGEEHITEQEALDNIDRQMDLALKAFAQAAQVETDVRQWAIKERGGVTRENIRLQAKLAAEKEARREKARQQQQARDLRVLQEKTLKTLNWLNKNKRRAPEELKAAFEEVLGDIDLMAINEPGYEYKQSWEKVIQSYEIAKESDPNFLPSAELEKVISRINGTKIGNMDVDALSNLYRAAVGLRTEYYNRNNVLNDELHRIFEEVYEDVEKEIAEAPLGMQDKKLWNRFFNVEQLTPMNVMQRMVGWNPGSTFYSMAKQLEKGERDVRAYTVKAKRMLDTFLTEHEDWVKKADGQGEDSIWYEIEVPELVELGHGDAPVFGSSVKVSMTPAQKVHLYLESKNYNNLAHMVGGRTFVNKELYQKGERQEAFAKGITIRLAPETVKNITKDLTAEEMELARLLESYYNVMAKTEINRVSNLLYGYDKAVGKDYAPIISNQNYTHSEIGKFDASAEGVGSMKERIQGAKNPSYNISAFDAMERHIDHTARFVGMAIPTRNWTTLLNWYGGNSSIKEILTQKWGQESLDYITNILTTLQSGVNPDASGRGFRSTTGQLPDKIMSNYISAVFGANPSIVLKQLGSIPLASAYLGVENLPNMQQLRDIDRGLIAKYTQELDWRTMGYSMPETKQLKDNPNWTQTNKTMQFVFGGGAITAMDGWAASTLWPWAENKVRREHPELILGSQEQIDAGMSPFYQKVAEEFNDAVSRSQSVSDEMHQGELRKNKNPVVRAFTLFQSDSAQTYNTLRQKIGEAQYYRRMAEQEEKSDRMDPDALADLKKKAATGTTAVGATVTALLINSIWAEGIDFLMNLAKYKGSSYEDEDDELTFGSVTGEMVKGMFGSMMGVVTFGGELADMIGVVMLGDEMDEVDSMALEQINAVMDILTGSLSSTKNFMGDAADVIANGGSFGKFLKDSIPGILGGIKDTAKATATYLAGVPANNVEAYLVGIMKWFLPGLEAEYQELMGNVDRWDLKGLEGKALYTRVESILNREGMTQNPETARVLAQLYEAGHTKAMPGSVPSEITVDGMKYGLTAYDEQAYGMVYANAVSDSIDALVSSEDFQNASADNQVKMLGILYEYGRDLAKVDFSGYRTEEAMELTGTTKDIETMKEFGLDVADSIRIKAQQNMIDDMYEDNMDKAVAYSEWIDGQAWRPGLLRMIDEHMPYQKSAMRIINKYEELGLDADVVSRVEDALAELHPRAGSDEVSDTQKMVAIMELGLSEEDQRNALRVRSGKSDESIEKKFQVLDQFYISSSTWIKALQTIEDADLQPLKGKKEVTETQKHRALADSDMTDSEMVKAMISICEYESTRDRIAMLPEYGVSAATWAKVKSGMYAYDENENGSITQKELEKALDAYGGANDTMMLLTGYATPLSDYEKAVLWQLQQKNWKPKNNPYDREVGQEIYNRLNER